MLARIGYYVLFLVAVGLYFRLALFNTQLQQQLLTAKKTAGRVFLLGQITILVALCPLVIIPWILSGFFSFSFALALLAGFEVGAIVVHLSYATFGISYQDIGAAVVLASAEVGARHPTGTKWVFQALGLIYLVGYVVTSTYVYFKYPLHSPAAVRAVLNATMPLLLMSWMSSGPIVLALIGTSRISDRTRGALFMQMASSLLPIGVLVTFYVSVDNVHLESLVLAWWPALSRFQSYLHWLPLAILGVSYLLILIVPYFIGLEGRRRNESAMCGAMALWTTRVVDIVGIPSEQDVDQLLALRAQLQAEVAESADAPIIRLATSMKTLDVGEANAQLMILHDAYRRMKDYDLRLVLHEFMLDLDRKIEEMIGEYRRVGNDPARPATYVELGRAFHQHFTSVRAHLQAQLDAVEAKAILAPVLARAAAVLGAAPLVFQYTQRVLKYLPMVVR